VLKQSPAQVQDLKKGDLFRVQHEGENGLMEFSPWQVALEDATYEEVAGNVHVTSDAVHLVMGNPVICKMTMRGDTFKSEPLSPTSVPTQNSSLL